MLRTIEFEDHGQDFLEWDIDEEGKVVDSRPFQAWAWNGTIVHNKDIRPGDLLAISSPRMKKSEHYMKFALLNYPVKSVRHADAGN